MNIPLRVLLFSLLGGWLAACAGAQITPPIPTAPPGRTLAQALEALDPKQVVLQLDFEPTFFRPEAFHLFGRVPAFTLFADGTVIYIDEGQRYDEQRVLQARLTPEETAGFLQSIIDLGFERLESHTDICHDVGGGMQECVADDSFTILRALTAEGALREVKIYSDFSDEPQVLEAVRSRLTGYSHPEAQAYSPMQATLFISPGARVEDAQIHPWTLEGRYLNRAAGGSLQAWVLEGSDLETFMAASPRNIGDFWFEQDGRLYNAYLIPWLPGADHRAAIRAEYPPPAAPAPNPTQDLPRLSDCPIPPDIADNMRFRVTYVESGDIWLLDEGQEARRLAQVGDAETLKFSPDGALVVFTRWTPGSPAALWAARTDSEFPIALTDGAGLKGEIEILAFSDAFPMVAFSHSVGPYNAELWVADLTGAGARRLASADQVYDLLDEPGNPPKGAIPISVAWMPGTPKLTYDAHPTYDHEGIYIYTQRQVAVVDALTGQQGMLLPKGQGGALTFSPDGRRAAVSSPGGLKLLDLVTGDLVPAGVDYFATGMGEYYVFPPLAWAPDSRSLVLVQPRQVGYDYDEPVTAFRVPADGSPATLLGEFIGYIPTFNLSPDGSLVAYWRAEPQSDFRGLHIAQVDGPESILAASGDLLEFINWAPDSRRFAYRFFDEGVTYIGDVCRDPVAILEEPLFIHPTWLDPLHFLFTQETDAGVALRLGTPGGLGGLSLVEGKQHPQFDLIAFPAP